MKFSRLVTDEAAYRSIEKRFASRSLRILVIQISYILDELDFVSLNQSAIKRNMYVN